MENTTQHEANKTNLDGVIHTILGNLKNTDILSFQIDKISRMQGYKDVVPFAKELAEAGFPVFVAAAVSEHGDDVDVSDEVAINLLITALEQESKRKPNLKVNNLALISALHESQNK